jgi:hypothetical protein
VSFQNGLNKIITTQANAVKTIVAGGGGTLKINISAIVVNVKITLVTAANICIL